MLLAPIVLAVSMFTPVRTLPAPTLSYARDAEYEYLGTEDGLWRTTALGDPAGPPLERIAFPGQRISSLVVRDGKLYVGKSPNPTVDATSTDHTLVVSSDHGATFVAIDADLIECLSGRSECRYMYVDQIVFDGDRMFVNSGGNLMVSANLGATWKQLYPIWSGPLGVIACALQYLPMGTSVLVGAECPLDIAWIRGGTLTPDRLGWSVEPQLAEIDRMENRNVQFIHLIGTTLWAGVEGGLLRSDDGGASFDWAIRFPLSSPTRYPYIRQMIGGGDALIVSGGRWVPFIASSIDDGRTWRDHTPLLGPAAHDVTLLVIDRGGRILVGYVADEGSLLGHLEVADDSPAMRRRTVRH